jgi:hypothetical protein
MNAGKGSKKKERKLRPAETGLSDRTRVLRGQIFSGSPNGAPESESRPPAETALLSGGLWIIAQQDEEDARETAVG